MQHSWFCCVEWRVKLINEDNCSITQQRCLIIYRSVCLNMAEHWPSESHHVRCTIYWTGEQWKFHHMKRPLKYHIWLPLCVSITCTIYKTQDTEISMNMIWHIKVRDKIQWSTPFMWFPWPWLKLFKIFQIQGSGGKQNGSIFLLVLHALKA